MLVDDITKTPRGVDLRSSNSIATSEIQEQILEIERDPTKCQAREVPLQDELFGNIALEVHLGIHSINVIHTRVHILVQISIQSFLAFLYAQAQDSKVDITGATDFGELS
jgi:hypothetical protein